MAKKNFIESSLLGVLALIKDSVFAEDYALRRGFLQTLDPRVKVLTFLLFIVQVVMTRNILIIFYLYLFCLFLAWISRVDMAFFIKRTWFFIPLFSVFIALPALFSIFTPGDALANFKIGRFSLTVTRQGMSGAVLFVARVITSVSFVVLLSVTSRHSQLLRVLRTLKVPQVFVMTAGMCYRYVYLFVEIIEHTYLAIKSRVGTRIHYRKGQDIVSWNIAYLWQRSFSMNEDIYRAMLSRGFHGEPQVMDDFRLRPPDGWWIGASVSISVLIFYLDNFAKLN